MDRSQERATDGTGAMDETKDHGAVPADSRVGDELPVLLGSAMEKIGQLNHDFGSDQAKLRDLRKRLIEGQFHLAVLGQFKRGKSTLINALLGDDVLPTSVVPVTAIPTFIRYGETLSARISFEDDRSSVVFTAERGQALSVKLARYVTETDNPRNGLGVALIEVFHPSSLLGGGLILIDTPGIGSTFRHNTQATLNFLPHCDAAIFLISADPPITEVEIEFLRQVQKKIGHLLFVINKSDYLNDAERQTAAEFLKTVLMRQVGLADPTPMFWVSARQGLQARQIGDAALYRQSGLGQIEDYLIKFLAGEKNQALRRAVARRASDIISDILMRLHMTVRSLELPMEQLEYRLMKFEKSLAQIQQEKTMVADLLAGDRRRMHDDLEDIAERLRNRGQAYMEERMQKRLAGRKMPEEAEVQAALVEVIPEFFEGQFGEMTAAMEKKIADKLTVHQARADALIESVRKTAADLFDVPYHAPHSAEAMETVEQPYWVTHHWDFDLGTLPVGWLDRFLPAAIRRSRLQRRLRERVKRLVILNVENLRWSMFQNIDRTFFRFGAAMEERLNETIQATHGAIETAMAKRRRQLQHVDGEIARLGTIASDLMAINADLGKVS